MTTSTAHPIHSHTAWKDYLTLCKPRVVLLMLLTAVVGMQLATPGFIPLQALIFGTLGIALLSAAAAAVNHVLDRRLDAIMARTQNRPIAKGRIAPREALLFAALLTVTGSLILFFLVNPLTMLLTLATFVGYAFIYTGYLKRATPQNIVIGGLAGAMPPLLGWVAVTGYFVPDSLLLVLIIYVWTPPHFWALAIYRQADYANAGIPMLPITHGVSLTKLHIFLYTILLIIVSILPTLVGMSGYWYLAGALLLNIRLLYWAIKLLLPDSKPLIAMRNFKFSIVYLLGLFTFLLADHYIYLLWS